MARSEKELLALLQNERRNSIGFEEDHELVAQRERALNYYQGDVTADLPAAKNRSQATSSDVSDAIETVLPDLMEIFTGGDDVLAFTPHGEEDEAAAEQETDYVKHVFFSENNGFLNLMTFIKDALLSKLGVFVWSWDATYGEGEEKFEGKTLEDAVEARQGGAEIRDLKLVAPDDYQGNPDADAVWSFTAYRAGGRLCIDPVPPEDFTAARDARLNIGAATYCAVRTRPRAQELIAQGIDPTEVAKLPAYSTATDGSEALARDTVAEQAQAHSDGVGDLRPVEVIEHYIRLLDDDGKTFETHRVLTGANESVLLHKEVVNRIQVAVATPYPMPHRLYGRSVADLMIEVMKIKTALMRLLLDSGYFAVNQRHQVIEDGMSEHTLSDLMRNEPMSPVRVKKEGAVTPLGSSGLDFDVTGALEFFSTVGEQRTGIVRNAQGLNPDSLHETARGAIALMGAAQKRTRLLARVIAETGLRDLFLGIHATLRENATQAATIRLRGGKWTPIDPTEWGERADMTVEVGLGAAGKEHDIAAIQMAEAMIDKIVQAQGGLAGPVVKAQNVYALGIRALEKLSFKSPERYLTDPSQPPDPAETQPQGQPPPDPKHVLAAQTEAAAHDRQVMQMQADAQVATQKAQAQAQVDAMKAQLADQQAQRDHDYRTAQLAQQREIELAKIDSAERIATGKAHTDIARTAMVDQTKRDVAGMQDQTNRLEIAGDIAVQTSEARDAATLADKDT